MATEKIYPRGIMCFPKHEKSPDFVVGSVVISINEFVKFCKENESLLTDYKGEKQLKLQALTGNKGMYFVVDTFKPTAKAATQNSAKPKAESEEDSLPF